MKTLLVLSFFPAFVPPSSGGESRLFNIYRELSRTFKVVLISSGFTGVPCETIEHSDSFREIRVPKSNEFAAAWSELVTGAGGGDVSAPALALSAKHFNGLHSAYLEHYPRADVIIHESPFLIDYDLFLGWDDKPRIYNAYNVEFDLYGAMHADGHGAISQIVQTCEEKTLRYIPHVLVCSEEDEERFRALYPFGNQFTLVPNGISAFRLDEIDHQRRAGLLFMGSGHLPNVQAADTIVQDIAPLFPDKNFDIIGDCLKPGRYGVNVTAHGRLSDAARDKMLRNAAFAINPITMGGGSSLKVADFASHGLPMISTVLGVRGFDFEPARHFFKLDFADIRGSLLAAFRGPADKVAETARRHIRQTYTWDGIARRMGEAIYAIIAKRDSRPTYLILNDYHPYDNIGGGCTRMQEVYRALAETANILVICFTDGDRIKLDRVGDVSVVAIPKSQRHIDHDRRTSAEFYISVVDIVAAQEVAHNAVMMEVYESARSIADLIICEHPYMVALPRQTGDRFVYASQNFELGLKRQMLQWHPSRDALLATLADVESYAVGCSALVTAVSDDDAAALGAAYPISAPIVTIPNGASEPASYDVDQHTDLIKAIGPRAALFLGSGHIPNVEAVQYIVETLAPQLSDVEFHIVGSVCQSFGHVSIANVTFWGVVNDARKSAICERCALAINPMLSGSGSNVKVADYLKNGLHVLTSSFGSRGYDGQGKQDLTLCELPGFALAIRKLLGDERTSMAARTERRRRLVDQLSMFANGRVYAGLLRDLLKKRPNALYVTYRYNYPRRGGGEVYVNRLIEGLAEHGYNVDVVAPAAVEIQDLHRFGSLFMADGGIGAIPVGQARVRTARFPIDDRPIDRNAVAAMWKSQPRYERELAKALPAAAADPSLGWGWGPNENGGRWAYCGFGFFLPEAATVTIDAMAIDPQALYIWSEKDGVLLDRKLRDHFSVTFSASQGWVECEAFRCGVPSFDDVRPLALYISSLRVGDQELVHDRPIDALRNAEPDVLFKAQYNAYRKSRHHQNLSLTTVRGPHCEALNEYVEHNIGDYDLLITHNAVFKTTTDSLKFAKKGGVPSIIIPHTHLEDDYYHFDDIYEAYETADTVLVSPKSAVEFLNDIGIAGVKYHAPGVDVEERFSQADLAKFHAVYRDNAPFFLVLGRKAGAKGYQDVIAACERLPKDRGAKVVLIGPDDDKLPVESDCATYLGPQERAVVRGALMACTALVNMSHSESFGIVLLEAGLAGAPVLANRHCPAFADLVHDDVNGFLVSSESLPDAMVRLLNQPTLGRRLGEAGRRQALKHDWSNVIADFVDHCDALLSKNMVKAI